MRSQAWGLQPQTPSSLPQPPPLGSSSLNAPAPGSHPSSRDSSNLTGAYTDTEPPTTPPTQRSCLLSSSTRLLVASHASPHPSPLLPPRPLPAMPPPPVPPRPPSPPPFHPMPTASPAVGLISAPSVYQPPADVDLLEMSPGTFIDVLDVPDANDAEPPTTAATTKAASLTSKPPQAPPPSSSTPCVASASPQPPSSPPSPRQTTERTPTHIQAAGGRASPAQGVTLSATLLARLRRVSAGPTPGKSPPTLSPREGIGEVVDLPRSSEPPPPQAPVVAVPDARAPTPPPEASVPASLSTPPAALRLGALWRSLAATLRPATPTSSVQQPQSTQQHSMPAIDVPHSQQGTSAGSTNGRVNITPPQGASGGENGVLSGGGSSSGCGDRDGSGEGINLAALLTPSSQAVPVPTPAVPASASSSLLDSQQQASALLGASPVRLPAAPKSTPVEAMPATITEAANCIPRFAPAAEALRTLLSSSAAPSSTDAGAAGAVRATDSQSVEVLCLWALDLGALGGLEVARTHIAFDCAIGWTVEARATASLPSPHSSFLSILAAAAPPGGTSCSPFLVLPILTDYVLVRLACDLHRAAPLIRARGCFPVCSVGTSIHSRWQRRRCPCTMPCPGGHRRAGSRPRCDAPACWCVDPSGRPLGGLSQCSRRRRRVRWSVDDGTPLVFCELCLPHRIKRSRNNAKVTNCASQHRSIVVYVTIGSVGGMSDKADRAQA